MKDQFCPRRSRLPEDFVLLLVLSVEEDSHHPERQTNLQHPVKICGLELYKRTNRTVPVWEQQYASALHVLPFYNHAAKRTQWAPETENGKTKVQLRLGSSMSRKDGNIDPYPMEHHELRPVQGCQCADHGWSRATRRWEMPREGTASHDQGSGRFYILNVRLNSVKVRRNSLQDEVGI